MIKNEELVLDEEGFQIFVKYRYDKSILFEEYPDNHTQLSSVELTIGNNSGRTIQLLPLLNDKQQDFIISKLSYE